MRTATPPPSAEAGRAQRAGTEGDHSPRAHEAALLPPACVCLPALGPAAGAQQESKPEAARNTVGLGAVLLRNQDLRASHLFLSAAGISQPCVRTERERSGSHGAPTLFKTLVWVTKVQVTDEANGKSTVKTCERIRSRVVRRRGSGPHRQAGRLELRSAGGEVRPTEGGGNQVLSDTLDLLRRGRQVWLGEARPMDIHGATTSAMNFKFKETPWPCKLSSSCSYRSHSPGTPERDSGDGRQKVALPAPDTRPQAHMRPPDCGGVRDKPPVSQQVRT